MTDTRTGLIWQRNLPVADYTWEEADAYCSSLKLAESGWRLPTKGELETLIDDTRMEPAIHPDVPGTVAKPYWTGSLLAGEELRWQVSFKDGASLTQDGSLEAKARCIASQSVLPDSTTPNRYAIGDGHIVLDKAINRSWQIVDGGIRTHDEAERYCSSLNLSGGGWRLPLRWELLTLVDVTRVDPAIDEDLFPATPVEAFWTASVYRPMSSRYWIVHFSSGSSQAARSESYRVRCVR